MLFGLSNAPATFQTVMNDALRSELGTSCVVYLDDVLVYSATLDDHYQHLERVLSLLHRNQLYAKPSKCIFATPELEFCGHIVGDGKLRAIPSKLGAIQDWPRPTNVQEVRQFLGLASYYRRFVREFARFAAPLQDLLRTGDELLHRQKKRPIPWTAGAESSFQLLKRKLIEAPVLAQPDVHQLFRIETDASEWALGCVLLQGGDDGLLHPIAFDGRKLKGAELNYPTQEKELLAIKHALRLWERYIENGTTTTVVTDHESLQYLQTTTAYSKRLAQWVEEFQTYDLEIRYRKGTDAVVPDAISRRPDFIQHQPANMAEQNPRLELHLSAAATWDACFTTRLKSLHGLTEREWLPAMLTYLERGELPQDRAHAEVIQSMGPGFRLRPPPYEDEAGQSSEQQLVRVGTDGGVAPFLELPFRHDLVQRLHEEHGHLGYPGLLGVIRPRAWWPTVGADIRHASRNCPACQVSQTSKPALERHEAHHQVKPDAVPFERWGIDLIGRLPVTPNGNRWIITAVDFATGWPVARALKTATDEEIARFLHEDIFVNYGAPRELLSDNGPNLLAGAVQHYVRLLKSTHRVTTPYHPRTNGKVENLNGLLGRMLTKYLLSKPTRLWDEYLHQALFAARIRTHATTDHSPFYLLYGVNPRIPSDTDLSDDINAPEEDWESRLQHVSHAQSLANETLLKRAIANKQIRDEAIQKPGFKEGQWVLVQNEGPQKFQSRWFGPYCVLKGHPLGTYTLEEPTGRVLRNLINGSRLIGAHTDKPERLWASARNNHSLAKRGLSITPGHEYEVQQILDQDKPVPKSYSELSSMSRREWEDLERRGKERAVGQDPGVVQQLIRRDQQRAAKHRTAATTPARTPAKGQAARSTRHKESDPDWMTGRDDSPDSEEGLSGDDDGEASVRDSSPDAGNPKPGQQVAAVVIPS